MDDFITEIIDDIFIVCVKLTRATLKEVNEFNKLLSSAIHNGYKKILVEMHEVEFIDSTFLGVLVVNLKKVTKTEGNLCLIGLRQSVFTIVRHTNLNKTFNIFPSREEALKSV